MAGAVSTDDRDKLHAQGRFTARERLRFLFDHGSFEEVGREGALSDPTSREADSGVAVIAGAGLVSGRKVFAFSQNNLCCADRLPAAALAPIAAAQAAALHARAPLVGLFDPASVSPDDDLASNDMVGLIRQSIECAGQIPQIALVMGPCHGLDAHLPALADLVVMRDGASLSPSGPEIIRAVFNRTAAAEALGSAAAHHEETGVASLRGIDDIGVLLQARRLLEDLPASRGEAAPAWPATEADCAIPLFDRLLPDEPDAPYDMREVIRTLADDGRFLELDADHATNLIVGFVRLEGAVVAMVGTQPAVSAGAIDTASARKAQRFLRFCSSFAIPLVCLIDTPGFLPESDRASLALLDAGNGLLATIAHASVPRVSVVLRRAFGIIPIALAARAFGCGRAFAWTGARMGSGGGSGASSSRDALGLGLVDAIIAPRDTRRCVTQALRTLRPLPAA